MASSNDRPYNTCAVFVGSKHAGNSEALTYLRTSVWPLVRNRLPDAKLHIVGTIAEAIDPTEADREGLKLIGPVADLASAISSNAVGLAPMDFGSGIPIKIVDYLAIGLPVVATDTTIAAFGDALDGIVTVAESSQHFAEQVVTLLEDDQARKTAAENAKKAPNRLNNDQLSRFLAR